MTKQLASALGDDALGDRVGVSVIDTVTGEQLFAADPDTAVTPASTTKIITCSAALAALGPDTRFSTRAVQGSAPGNVVLVGGGDPSSRAPQPSRTATPSRPASPRSPPAPPRRSSPRAYARSLFRTTRPCSPASPRRPAGSPTTSPTARWPRSTP
ncbi:D-alanyl-D-alanine carboxypeptidase [Nonomuraea rubra]|uniref:D-alanyl-D-alanine carboxypeptidase n=1 Tax=Nonomuraea rubra TaxID=46180 RepID=UPI00361872F6